MRKIIFQYALLSGGLLNYGKIIVIVCNSCNGGCLGADGVFPFLPFKSVHVPPV